MTDRWQRVSSVFHGALDRGGDDRAAYLKEACGSDPELRREVESLLAQSVAPGSLLETPVRLQATGDAAELPGALVGRQFGVYIVEAFIGAGGMGEVYRARDSRLHRDVAIKFSREKFSERFQREAEIIARLNHPHICTLYDVGPDYLVMEYINGRPLDGPMPLDKLLEYAGQICSALDYAHRSGVIHRDLKPANILVTKHGVKLVDFGIARMPGNDATLTKPGQAVGTPMFMAPELWNGTSGDARSDVFAFGRLLSYLATGSISADRTLRPPPLDRVVRTCLATDPDDRWQTPREVNIALDAVRQPAVAPPSGRRWAPWVATAIALAIAGAALFVALRPSPPADTQVLRAAMAAPDRTEFALIPPAVSPDGRVVAFTGTAPGPSSSLQIWTRAIDSLVSRPLAGTEGGGFPFWSPDSRSIGFFADGKLKTVSAAGGPVVTIADVGEPRGGSWGAGVIVFAPANGGPIHRVAASGGTPTPVTVADLASGESSHRWPWFLPDGRHFLYVAMTLANPGRLTVRVGSIDSSPPVTLFEGESNVIYAARHVLFLRGATLMAQPFDERGLTLTGGALPVAEQIQRTSAVGGGMFSASSGGLLVYRTASASSQFTWFDRGGARLSTFGDPFVAGGRLQFSPDRGRVAVSMRSPISTDRSIWIYDVGRGLGTRFTMEPTPEIFAAWSPDGQTLAFNSGVKGRLDLYRRRVDAGGPDELICADGYNKWVTSWSPDRKFLLYHANGDIWMLPDPLGPAGASKPVPFLHERFTEQVGMFAPGGGWVLYESNESGRFEIYVTKFPGPAAKRQISTGGGTRGRWSPRGDEIFYTAPDGGLMSAQISIQGDTLSVREVRSLFPSFMTSPDDSYDVASDGRRFLALVPPAEAPAPTLVLLQNWTQLLKK